MQVSQHGGLTAFMLVTVLWKKQEDWSSTDSPSTYAVPGIVVSKFLWGRHYYLLSSIFHVRIGAFERLGNFS